MATPIFKFQHPNYKYHFYVIHNTYSALPETIPMDLATFVIYQNKTGRKLSGFLLCWEDLKETGSSLSNTTFEDYFTNEEKLMLYDLAIDSGAVKTAEENEFLSEKIKLFIDDKLYESQSFADFIEAIALSAIDNFRALDYYKSLHSLFLLTEDPDYLSF
jgi:hypothetical protein